jgi:uncharacterized protein (UPF0276 family)
MPQNKNEAFRIAWCIVGELSSITEKLMRFAINWSPEAAALLDEGKIGFDLYKCPDWPELVADAQKQVPAYIHFPITIGDGQAETWDFAKIHKFLETTETTLVNSHITPHANFFPQDISLDDLIAALRKEIEMLSSEFGAEHVTIENCPDFIGNIRKGFLQQAIEPALFQALVAETGCGLLLDISHAHMTCDKLELDLAEYLKAMPVHALRELHVTGMGQWSNGVYGDHMPMTPPDWERFELAMEEIGAGNWAMPEIVAFEYGGIAKLKELCGSDKDAIAENTPRLYAGVQEAKLKRQMIKT